MHQSVCRTVARASAPKQTRLLLSPRPPRATKQHTASPAPASAATNTCSPLAPSQSPGVSRPRNQLALLKAELRHFVESGDCDKDYKFSARLTSAQWQQFHEENTECDDRPGVLTLVELGVELIFQEVDGAVMGSKESLLHATAVCRLMFEVENGAQQWRQITNIPLRTTYGQHQLGQDRYMRKSDGCLWWHDKPVLQLEVSFSQSVDCGKGKCASWLTEYPDTNLALMVKVQSTREKRLHSNLMLKLWRRRADSAQPLESEWFDFSEAAQPNDQFTIPAADILGEQTPLELLDANMVFDLAVLRNCIMESPEWPWDP